MIYHVIGNMCLFVMDIVYAYIYSIRLGLLHIFYLIIFFGITLVFFHFPLTRFLKYHF